MILAFPQAGSADRRIYAEVKMFNALPDRPLLTVYCKSRKEDLGTHEILPGTEWGFKLPHPDVTMLYFRRFEWLRV